MRARVRVKTTYFEIADGGNEGCKAMGSTFASDTGVRARMKLFLIKKAQGLSWRVKGAGHCVQSKSKEEDYGK